jgi:hypothetical protein
MDKVDGGDLLNSFKYKDNSLNRRVRPWPLRSPVARYDRYRRYTKVPDMDTGPMF